MLEIKIDVKQDEHGVFSGVELARHLIFNAVSLLVPYVKSCPACLDEIFSSLANDILADIHASLKEDPHSVGYTYTTLDPGEERSKAVDAHLEESRPMVEAMLQSQSADHQTH